MSFVLQQALEPGVHLKDKLSYLRSIHKIHSLQLEKEEDIVNFKRKIQELIVSPLERQEGLIFMQAALYNRLPIYIDNWGQVVLGSLKCADQIFNKELALNILMLNLKNFSHIPQHKVYFSKLIPDILPMLFNSDEECLSTSCRCLALCMQNLPEFVGRHMAPVEKFLLKHSASLLPDVVQGIAICFAAQPMCIKHSLSGRMPYADIWLRLCTKTLNTLQSILDQLLVGNEGNDETVVKANEFEAFDVYYNMENEFSEVSTFTRMFASLCKCLAMLISSETNRVQIPSLDLLRCILRIFKVNELPDSKADELKSSFFKFFFSDMHQSVFILLEALILKCTLIEQAGNFTRILVKSLEAPKILKCADSVIRHGRSVTWKILNIWLKQYGSRGSNRVATDKFIVQELLNDIAFDTTNSFQSQGGALRCDQSWTSACIEALKALKTLIVTGSGFMEKTIMDNISVTVIMVTKKIQLKMNPSVRFPFPYHTPKCRKLLYELLLTCSIYGDPLETKFVMQSIALFRFALKDPSIKVTEVCHTAQKLCRFYLNPKKPPPESIYTSFISARPPPQENTVHDDWENGAKWNANGQINGNRASDSQVPCQIENIYHSGVDNGVQMEPLQRELSSPPHYSEGDSQCNSNYRTISKHSSQSDAGDEESESGGDIDEDECSENDGNAEVSSPERVFIPASVSDNICPAIIDSAEVHTVSANEPAVVETELETVISDEAEDDDVHDEDVSSNPRETVNENNQNCVEVEENEVEISTLPTKAPENGMDVSDEESGEYEEEDDADEEEDEEDDEEDVEQPKICNSESEIPEKQLSPENYGERPAKKARIMTEESSSNEEGELSDNDQPSTDEKSAKISEQHGGDIAVNNASTAVKDDEKQTSVDNGTDDDEDKLTIEQMCADYVSPVHES